MSLMRAARCAVCPMAMCCCSDPQRRGGGKLIRISATCGSYGPQQGLGRPGERPRLAPGNTRLENCGSGAVIEVDPKWQRWFGKYGAASDWE